MTTNRLRSFLVLAIAAVAATSFAPDLKGYVLSGHKWATSQVVYYINPSNIYVSDAEAAAAIQEAAAAWSSQSNANVSLVFGGYTNGSTAAYDGQNQVFFRNDAGGGYTYTWWNSSNQTVEADVILYEASRPMFTGSTGCSGGIYIEDLATHEFGHVLGLSHATDVDATMYANTNYCDTNWRSLSADDIAGIESLYPPTKATQAPAAPSQLSVAMNAANPTASLVLSWSDNASNESGYRIERSPNGASFAQVAQVVSNVSTYVDGGLASGATYYYRVVAYNSGGTSAYSGVAAGQTQAQAITNTAPLVSIGNPVNGAQYPAGSSITFSGTATDAQDGDLTSRLQWTSSIDGNLGTGGTVTGTLSPGTHTIRAAVADAAGVTGWADVTMTVAATQSTTSPPSLSARGYKVKTSQRVDLTWSGAETASVDVYRNGARIRTTANDGSDTDSPNKRSSSYTYKICNAGTSVCSNQATASF